MHNGEPIGARARSGLAHHNWTDRNGHSAWFNAVEPLPFYLGTSDSPDRPRYLRQLLVGVLPQQIRDAKCQLNGLACVEAWIARGLVTAWQMGVQDLLRSAEAFGHVLAGQLEVHA